MFQRGLAERSLAGRSRSKMALFRVIFEARSGLSLKNGPFWVKMAHIEPFWPKNERLNASSFEGSEPKNRKIFNFPIFGSKNNPYFWPKMYGQSGILVKNRIIFWRFLKNHLGQTYDKFLQNFAKFCTFAATWSGKIAKNDQIAAGKFLTTWKSRRGYFWS